MKEATRVRVALTGSIWFSPDLDIEIPANLTDPPPGFADLGFTTADGVQFTIGREVQSIDGWQSMDPLRQLVTAEPKTAAFTLRQFGRDEWLATMGGTIVALGGGGGTYRWEPAQGKIPEGVLLIDFTDDDLNYRFGFRRAQQTGEVQFSLVRSDAVNLPNTWTAVAPGGDEKAFFMDTDDPAFAPAEEPGGPEEP